MENGSLRLEPSESAFHARCPSPSCGCALTIYGLDGDSIFTDVVSDDRANGQAGIGRCGECNETYDFLIIGVSSSPIPFDAFDTRLEGVPHRDGSIQRVGGDALLPAGWGVMHYDLPDGGLADLHVVGPFPGAITPGEFGVSRCASQRDVWERYDGVFAALAPTLVADMDRRERDRTLTRGDRER